MKGKGTRRKKGEKIESESRKRGSDRWNKISNCSKVLVESGEIERRRKRKECQPINGMLCFIGRKGKHLSKFKNFFFFFKST